MGCGPSRPINRRPGSNLAADCSGSYCDIAINDISDVNIMTLIPDGLKKRLSAEIILMDVDTLNRFKTLVDPSTVMTSTAKFGVTYSKIIRFINENGSNLTDAQVNLLMDAASSGSNQGFVGVMFFYMSTTYFYAQNGGSQSLPSVPANLSAWYSRYVEMLYNELTKTPAHTTTQLNVAVLEWILANRPPITLPSSGAGRSPIGPATFEGPDGQPIPVNNGPIPAITEIIQDNGDPIRIQSDISAFTNPNSILQNVINNVGNNMRNKKVSGFSDFKPYDGAFVKHRFNNGFHPF